ncbi:PSD1 and planctomycete cytochrome C domain-containing protein [Roseimaritima ulvae]|uniref:PSD1 and planctomycete cytochrome C domain-containing protein n=1 Tax=Roseimaritima ulvae TaxID=980254 RepID=UPI00083765E0|nr:PSD1 and planctomycete cytochrome C domain-containing protein [Roseimaritima ulvae]
MNRFCTPLLLTPTLCASFVFCLASALPCHGDEAANPEQLEFFEKQVRPLLAEHCYECHSVRADKLQAGLLMDSRASLLEGGDSGEAMVPGDPDASLIIEAVRYESYEMPPNGKLSDQDIQTLEKWVQMGAPWPQEDAPTAEPNAPVFDLQARKAEQWAWQPIAHPPLPNVHDTDWPRDDLDRFILAKLEAAELSPAADADRRALVRRLYFDLTGLPPTPEQVRQALAMEGPQATAELVDQLLDSPAFGERWGRHWLDLVRYAESRGHEFDNDAENAYQYRDYVIRAFNADVPYDQLVREHLAGDLLSNPRLNPETGANESVLGTGFWFLGEWVHSPVDIRKDEADRFDNMIDVMSKTFLGVTVACARCHDHKFDPISTADYYSLSGFLQSSDYRQVRFESLEHNRRIAQQLDVLDTDFRRQINAVLADAVPPMADQPSKHSDAAVSIDYANLSAGDWMQDGYSFGMRARHAGQLVVAEQDGQPQLHIAPRHAAASDPFWNGLQSIGGKGVHNRGRLEKLPRSGRTLRTPTIDLTDGDVAIRVHGSGHVVACVDSHRLIAGPLHGQTIAEIKPGNGWVRMNLKRYVGHRVHFEFTPKQDATLEVCCVTQGATPKQLKNIERREATIAAAAEARQAAIEQWLQSDDAAVAEVRQLLALWDSQRRELSAQVRRKSQIAMGMMDGSGEDDHVLIRGNAGKPGKLEPRHFLTAITGDAPLPLQTRSGRLELAAQINDPANPLTARVIVNRIWHHLMGRGIVPTTDDFGVLGQRPTHPELLDHLAQRFLADGRSIKRMIRTIALSRSYQMSSHSDPAAVQADPKNLLWHHRPPARLQGEAIRDALLTISGQLDQTMYGEPVPIHLTSFMDGRGRPGHSGPLDGQGRRSIYISVRRNFLSPFMLTFDTPVPFSTMGRRNVSNVPAQALILMNDPFVVAQTQAWAERALSVVPPSDDQNADIGQRIDWMYQSAFARPADEQEQQIATAFLQQQATARELGINDAALWADLAHALVNTKEFIFLR